MQPPKNKFKIESMEGNFTGYVKTHLQDEESACSMPKGGGKLSAASYMIKKCEVPPAGSMFLHTCEVSPVSVLLWAIPSGEVYFRVVESFYFIVHALGNTLSYLNLNDK